MSAKLRSRLSYANVMATIAVFVALGGTAYAATSIDGKLIKNRSIAGIKLKKDTLGGEQINESKLGQVPSAARADLAATAESAKRADAAAVADSAKRADQATSATSATNASKAANANLLDNLDSAELSPGTGDGRIAPLRLTVDYMTVLSANIRTARAASLLVSASVSVYSYTASWSGVDCHLLFDGTTASVSYSTSLLVTLGEKETLPVVWAQGVGAGTHTVDLRCSGAGANVSTAGMIVSAHV